MVTNVLFDICRALRFRNFEGMSEGSGSELQIKKISLVNSFFVPIVSLHIPSYWLNFGPLASFLFFALLYHWFIPTPY